MGFVPRVLIISQPRLLKILNLFCNKRISWLKHLLMRCCGLLKSTTAGREDTPSLSHSVITVVEGEVISERLFTLAVHLTV